VATPRSEFEIDLQMIQCPTELAVELLSGRWKALILYRLLEKKQRYGELKKQIPGINDKMLAEQLRKLEEAGLVFRHVYATVPPKVEYELTPLGEGLRTTFKHLSEWGRRFQLEAERQSEA
jgi:DNA-binding HxlR family transcriptional regulator